MDAPAQQLVYLDNSATSYPKPPEVVEAVRACLSESLTVQRSTHLAGFRGDEVLRRCRVKLARFMGAAHPEEIIYTYSATDGLNIALQGWLRPGDHVIISPLEHHSVMRPLHHLREKHGVSWTELPADRDGVVHPESIRNAVRSNTRAVVINWIGNVSGTVQPAREIGELCSEMELPYIIDAAQATGAHPVDVQALHCDAMAQPAHKALMSLPGLGVLYVRKGFELEPWRIGGTGYRSDLVEQPSERPMRFESGTPNVPAIVGLDAAMDWFERVGLENITQHCAALTRQMLDGLSVIERVRVIGPPASALRGHLTSFIVDDALGHAVDPLVISQVLSERFRISSRAGLHCAPTAHRHFGTLERGGTVRFSVGYFTTVDEVAYALGAVKEVVAGMG